MSKTGERFVTFMRIKLNQDKAEFDATFNKPEDLKRGQKRVKYPETRLAQRLNLNYKTVNRRRGRGHGARDPREAEPEPAR